MSHPFSSSNNLYRSENHLKISWHSVWMSASSIFQRDFGKNGLLLEFCDNLLWYMSYESCIIFLIPGVSCLCTEISAVKMWFIYRCMFNFSEIAAHAWTLRKGTASVPLHRLRHIILDSPTIKNFPHVFCFFFLWLFVLEKSLMA